MSELTRQMEMVQMLQMQFMQMHRGQLRSLFSAVFNFMDENRRLRVMKVINKEEALAEEDIACIAVTLALHLSGVEE